MNQIVIACFAAVVVILLVLIRKIADLNEELRSARSKAVSQSDMPTLKRDIPEEVVAAISAAVCCLCPGTEIKVIQPAESCRPSTLPDEGKRSAPFNTAQL
jgi:hypothetical protein